MNHMKALSIWYRLPLLVLLVIVIVARCFSWPGIATHDTIFTTQNDFRYCHFLSLYGAVCFLLTIAMVFDGGFDLIKAVQGNRSSPIEKGTKRGKAGLQNDQPDRSLRRNCPRSAAGWNQG
jgi:hypothetical protein